MPTSKHRWGGAGCYCLDCGAIKDTRLAHQACEGQKIVLHRDKTALSRYSTPDDRWTVWRDEQRFWYVNDNQLDETELSDGWRTKREAVAYLRGVVNRPDWE